MKVYSGVYVSKESGEEVKEVFVGKNEKEVLRLVIQKGTPLSVKELNAHSALKVSTDYKQQFLMAILFHVKSGMSAGKALEEIIKDENGTMRTQLNPALHLLMAGGSFSDAMTELDMYDTATIAIMRAGERIGAMQQALQSAVDHHEKAQSSKKLLYGVLFGLTIDIVFSVASVLSVQFGLLPKISEDGIQSTDPLAIESFKNNLSMAYWVNGTLTVFTLIAIVLFGWLIYAYRQKSNNNLRLMVDQKLGVMPVVKDLFLHAAIARTFLMTATLIRGGVSLNSAIEIIKSAPSSPIVDAYWVSVSKKLESGYSVVSSLKSQILNSAELLIITAHKDSEQLADALTNISKRRDELAIRANKRFGMVAFIGAILYSSISVLIALFASYIQYQSMMSGMMSAGG